MPTDREYLKQQQAGALGTTGATDPVGTVGKAHSFRVTFDVASDANFAERGLRVDVKCRVKSAHFVPASALATDATNFVTQTVSKRDGAGGSATTIATAKTETTGGAAMAAFVPFALTVTESASVLDAGQVLTFKHVESGTPTSPVGFCVVVLEAV